MHRTLLILTLALTLAGACDGPTPDDGADGAREPTTDEVAASDTALAGDADGMPQTAPLLRIMAWLAEDMERISAGLWREDYALIADAAYEVAYHPKVTEEERRRIFGVLGDDAGGFRQADLYVHETATELRDAAVARNMDRVLARYSDLQRGCVACHDAYRDRLREAATDTVTGE